MSQPTTSDDRRVSRALGTSVLLRAADRLISLVWEAAEQSRVAVLSGRRAGEWLGLAPNQRATAIGIALLVASATHIVLMTTHEMPAGWLWLVPPGISATVGMMMLAWRRSDVKAGN